MATDQELIDFYANLLIIQYKTKPKAKAHIGLLVKEAIANQIILQTKDAFDLETAVGEQLDILAGYLGLKRNITGLDLTKKIYTLADYNDTPPVDSNGFGTYDKINNAIFLRYADANQSLFYLNDFELRFLTKFRAKVFNSNSSVKEINDIINEFFGSTALMIDNQNMTITYAYAVSDTQRLFDIVNYSGSLPKPAGVGIIIIKVSAPTLDEIYGLGNYDESISVRLRGLGTYSLPSPGVFLRY